MIPHSVARLKLISILLFAGFFSASHVCIQTFDELKKISEIEITTSRTQQFLIVLIGDGFIGEKGDEISNEFHPSNLESGNRETSTADDSMMRCIRTK